MFAKFIFSAASSTMFYLALLAFMPAIRPDLLHAQKVGTREDIAHILVVDNIKVEDGSVSGIVHNRTSHPLRDVQLFIRYTWLWDNERHPGKADPGRSEIYELPKEIPPGETGRFTFTPSPPLPKPAGGHFETTVSVAGFTEVIPQTGK